MENNYLVASDFRKKARTSLKGKWEKGILVFSIVFLLTVLIYLVVGEVFEDELLALSFGYISLEDTLFLILGLVLLGIIQEVIYFACFLYAKKITTGEDVGLLAFFEIFRRFKDVFLLIILETVFTFLWALLFVIPGIVAAYRYRLAIYILFDNPSKTPMDCIRESKKIMDGRKGRLFCLDLSFFGWYLLSLIPANIMDLTSEYIGIVLLIVLLVISFASSAIVCLYFFTASAEFYKEVIENELPQESVTADSSELYIDDTKNDNNKISETTDYNERSYYRDPSEFGHVPKDEDKKDQESPEL